ncbi:MAG: hypothetical protein JRJ85_28100 [Deltaproteobacteria bacterium]|nr:hypothetical protein [Deltaproteobacteria bacterium]
MGVRVTVLSENTACAGGILAEFGWSVLIEVDGQKILLDTGPGISACYNGMSLPIPISGP